MSLRFELTIAFPAGVCYNTAGTTHKGDAHMDSEKNNELEFSELDLPELDDERPVGYRRPEKNRKKQSKSRVLGLLSLCLSLLGVALLLCLGIYGVSHWTDGTLSGSILIFGKAALLACGILALGALVLALIALFRRRQTKLAAIFSLLLSLLLLAVCVAVFWGYTYLFGAVEKDKDFQNLSQDDLNVVQTGDSGEILRQTEPVESSIDPAEIESKNLGREIEWEYLTDEDLPDEVKEIIYGAKPENASYLLPGYEQISTFVLYGTDDYNSSDSIILLSVDRVHKKIKMISIARDTYVTIPQWGSHSKINYAYTWGGAQMAVSTLNYNFFLNVTDYITVDTNQLESIVDLVGGVDIELTRQEANYLAHSGYAHSGECHLDGDMAVKYARLREIDTEINRTGRQRKLLTAMMTSIGQMPLNNYPKFIRSCLGMCTTSFQMDELMDIVLEVVQNDYTIESYAILEQVPYWGGSLGAEGHFYCVYDLNYASDVIYRLIYEDLYLSGYPDELPDNTEE